jgi:hypothetical protein
MLRDLLAGAAIDDHRMRQMLGIDVILEAQHVRRLAVFQRIAPAAESDGRIRQRHGARGHDAAQPQIDMKIARQPLALRGELLDQHAADGTRPDDPQRDRMG